MEKVYRRLPWLSASDTARFLGLLTKSPVTVNNLRQFCIAGHCAAYIDCDEAEGTEHATSLDVLADGVQKLEQPECMRNELFQSGEAYPPEEVLFSYNPLVTGPAWVYSDEDFQPKHSASVKWRTVSDCRYEVMFKPSEIEALAAKMNGEAEQQSGTNTELDSLREQLEQAKAELEAVTRATQAEEATKPSHLLAIAGLLKLLKDRNRPSYTQETIAAAIEAIGWPRCSGSNLSKMFAEANKAEKEQGRPAKAKA